MHMSASHILIKLICTVQSLVHFQLLSPTALLAHPAVVNPPHMCKETVWKVACNCVWRQSSCVFSCHVGCCQQHLLLAVRHNQSDCQLRFTLCAFQMLQGSTTLLTDQLTHIVTHHLHVLDAARWCRKVGAARVCNAKAGRQHQ